MSENIIMALKNKLAVFNSLCVLVIKVTFILIEFVRIKTYVTDAKPPIII